MSCVGIIWGRVPAFATKTFPGLGSGPRARLLKGKEGHLWPQWQGKAIHQKGGLSKAATSSPHTHPGPHLQRASEKQPPIMNSWGHPRSLQLPSTELPRTLLGAQETESAAFRSAYDITGWSAVGEETLPWLCDSPQGPPLPPPPQG